MCLRGEMTDEVFIYCIIDKEIHSTYVYVYYGSLVSKWITATYKR